MSDLAGNGTANSEHPQIRNYATFLQTNQLRGMFASPFSLSKDPSEETVEIDTALVFDSKSDLLRTAWELYATSIFSLQPYGDSGINTNI